VEKLDERPKSIEQLPSRQAVQGGCDVITASALAGYLAAHAIWSVSNGEMLIPMLGYVGEDEKRVMNRLVGPDASVAVEEGRKQLASNSMDANDAVLLYDGRITLGDRKVDAILIEIRAYFSPQSEMTLAVPYTPKSSGAFRVHKPKVLVWKGCEDFDLEQVLRTFWSGVDGHQQGSKIWAAALDESI
jgi:hypothetical protein